MKVRLLYFVYDDVKLSASSKVLVQSPLWR